MLRVTRLALPLLTRCLVLKGGYSTLQAEPSPGNVTPVARRTSTPLAPCLLHACRIAPSRMCYTPLVTPALVMLNAAEECSSYQLSRHSKILLAHAEGRRRKRQKARCDACSSTKHCPGMYGGLSRNEARPWLTDGGPELGDENQSTSPPAHKSLGEAAGEGQGKPRAQTSPTSSA